MSLLLKSGILQNYSNHDHTPCESRGGMLFHPYDWAEIEELTAGYNISYKADKGKREHVAILRKSE